MHIPVFPPRRLYTASHSLPLQLPIIHLLVWPPPPPPPVARPPDQLLVFVPSPKMPLWTPFSITAILVARSPLHLTTCLMRNSMTKSYTNVRSSKRRMAILRLSGPFLQPSDASVGSRVKARRAQPWPHSTLPFFLSCSRTSRHPVTGGTRPGPRGLGRGRPSRQLHHFSHTTPRILRYCRIQRTQLLRNPQICRSLTQ